MQLNMKLVVVVVVVVYCCCLILLTCLLLTINFMQCCKQHTIGFVTMVTGNILLPWLLGILTTYIHVHTYCTVCT